MSLSKEELQKEQEYLDKTLKVLRSLITSDDESILKDQSDVEEFKQYFWSSITDMDDMEISTNRQAINSQINRTNQKIEQLSKLKRSLNSPYFGRVDFYTDRKDITTVYVGINGIHENLDFYVFDWRSPIGSLFYNYNVGPASYEAPIGEIKGEIRLKRQYKIEEGKLVRCFNSDINIDDEYLQEILSKNSGDKMRNIVNSIQAEQNTIIRNLKDRLLIVQGIAGSGKTSVALHRIAYLLYHEKNLRSTDVLIFSPNDVFSKYISNVLPELGEENVMQSTFSSFAESYLREFKEVESFTSFTERFYQEEMSEEEKELITYKLSDDIKEQLDFFITEYKERIKFNGGLTVGDKLFTKEELNHLIKSRYHHLGLISRIEAIADYICETCRIPSSKYKGKIKKILISKIIFPLDVKAVYKMFLNGLKNKPTIQKELSKSKINFEDLIPYLYIKFELFGYPKNIGIKQVVIDEAQDYTKLQFTMLAKIFNNSSFTILGDINQTINPYYIHDDLSKVGECFQHEPNYIELNKTYRSTEEIIKYSNEILGLNNMVSVRHNYAPVEQKDVATKDMKDNILEDITRLKNNGINRIAIITKTFEEAQSLFNELTPFLPELSLVTGFNKTKLTNIMIMPSYLSKGLEFDGVIACTNIDNLYREEDRYLYYVVCTRAQHQLIIYNQKNLIKKKEQTYEKRPMWE